MVVSSYYYGNPGKLSGIVIDTNKRVYATFNGIDKSIWCDRLRTVPGSEPLASFKDDFHIPGDMLFRTRKKSDLHDILRVVDEIGYEREPDKILDFGCYQAPETDLQYINQHPGRDL